MYLAGEQDNSPTTILWRIRVKSAPSQVGLGQVGQVNSACMGTQVWGKGG